MDGTRGEYTIGDDCSAAANTGGPCEVFASAGPSLGLGEPRSGDVARLNAAARCLSSSVSDGRRPIRASSASGSGKSSPSAQAMAVEPRKLCQVSKARGLVAVSVGQDESEARDSAPKSSDQSSASMRALR